MGWNDTSGSRRTRLLALVQKRPGLSPGQRYRIEQWAPYLRDEHGVDIDYAPFESARLTEVLYEPGRVALKARLLLADATRRWRGRRSTLEYDAVVIYRESMLLGGAWLERWIRGRDIPFLADFDDSIWLWDSATANGLFSLARMPWKAAAMCRLADGVTVGNAYLAEYARRYNRHVVVVPTTIDLASYPVQPWPRATALFTVVWTGSHTTLAHFETIRPALERLGARLPLRVRVICSHSPAPLRNAELEFVPWRAASEAADLSDGEVGIMPIPDTPFTRGKCGLKALQYMAIGRPAVVSPVGVNRDIVQDGENGFWAATEDEWVDRLERLARDRALAERMGQAARRTVEDRYGARRSAALFAGALRDVIARRHVASSGA